MTNAERLRSGRLALGLTLDQMGEALGYKPSRNRRTHIYKMEAGIREVPQYRVLLLEHLLKGAGADV